MSLCVLCVCRYTIVGLEQASNSVQLGQFRFPKKVVIVLGTEREGLPMEALKELDVCIEIPQLGVIR